MQYARWITTRTATGMRFVLRAGAKGRGRILGACESWANGRSLERANSICATMQARVEQAGYVILPTSLPEED